MDVQQLGDVVVPSIRIFLLEGSSNGSRFILNECALICKGLPLVSDQSDTGYLTPS